MKKIKKLMTSEESNIIVTPPFNDDVMLKRDEDYIKLSDKQFAKSYREYAHVPAYIDIKNEHIEIQFNKCSNPFCGRYGQQQKKFENIKGKPSRYIFNNRTECERSIECSTIAQEVDVIGIIKHITPLVSNWSVADEIKRLITINSVIPIAEEYDFHKEGCSFENTTPFAEPKNFYKKGTSTSNSPKFQCKSCKKNINIKPAQDKSFNYHQKKNNILPLFIELIISRTPVKRTCEILKISPKTYYHKLEWVYRKCLEFLERNETKKFETHVFNDLWINTDTFTYVLNNVKLKGKGGKKSFGHLDKKMMTYVIASCDLNSGYVLRNDIAYDYDITMEQIELDTKKYHCDHSFNYLGKNSRLRYSYAPQEPSEFDSQSQDEYEDELISFNVRKNYIEGVHVKTQYSALAHYFLLDKMLNISNKIYFVSDNDASLQLAINRVYTDRFSKDMAIYFTSQVDKTFTLEEAGSRYFQKRQELSKWAKEMYPGKSGLENQAYMKILSELQSHDFFDYKTIKGIDYPYKSRKTIKHPLPYKDEGERYINVISPIRNLRDDELANLLLQVNGRAIDNYFQSIRRKLSVLERPLVTARGDGRCYIYANYNPKYAQQILTIFRTLYNFCTPQGKGNTDTPAMKIGIANKIYTYKDILYFR